MYDEEITVYLKPLINSLDSGNISQLKAMKLHIKLLLDIRALGISPAKIISVVGFKYSTRVFSSRLSECKKAYYLNEKSGAIAEKEAIYKSPVTTITSNTPQTVNDSVKLIYNLDEWITATRLGKGSINLFQQGEEDGLIPSDFNGLASYNNLKVINIFTAWEEIVANTIVNESKKPTKEQFLSTFKR